MVQIKCVLPIILILFLGYSNAFDLKAQRVDKCNFSGLKDEYLRRRVSSAQEQLKIMETQLQGRTEAEGGLPDFHMDVVTGKKIHFSEGKGGVESILLDCESANSIKGTIYINGMSKGHLQIEITNARYQTLLEIEPKKVSISGSNSLPFEIQISESSPQNIFFSSAFIKLTYFESINVTKGKPYWFDLPKSWKKSINQADIIHPLLLINKQENISHVNSPLLWGNGTKKKIPQNIDLSQDLPSQVNNLFGCDLKNIFFDSLKNDFLYIPKGYYLNINDATKGSKYGMQINYGNLSNENGLVSFTINLHTGITKQEISIIKNLLQQKFGLKSISLKPLPIEGEISSNLSIAGQLGIKNDQINIGKVRDFSEEVIVSFNCDLMTSDELLSQLSSGVKITGSLGFGTTFVQSIPLEIDLMDSKAFGLKFAPFDYLTNASTLFKNDFPFPITINRLVLYDSEAGYSKGYGVSLNEIGPQARTQISNSSIINLLPNENRKFDLCWFEYEMKSCKSCFDELIADISSGSIESRRKFIRFENFYTEIFDLYKAKAIKIAIKSPQIDPRNVDLKTLTYDLNPSQDVIEMGPLFSTNESNINYQYQFEVITSDETFQSIWIPAKSLELYLQRTSFERAFANSNLIKK